MIPTKIILDPTFINVDGSPSQSADIYEDHLRVHPDYKDTVLEGLQKMFGDIFEIVEE